MNKAYHYAPDGVPISTAVKKAPPVTLPASPARAKVSSLAQELFGIDLRTLAFFRIALALTLLADLFMRSVDIEAFYTDFGLLPRGAPLRYQWGHAALFCFHTITGSTTGMVILLALNLIPVFMLLLGWKTRWANVLCWLFLISLQSRNQLVLQGGDVLIRCLTFWAMFLPLGAYLSLDARNATLPRLPGADPRQPVREFSVATVASLLQMAILYLCTALLKTDPAWWSTGYAVYLALNVDQLTRPLGRWVAQFPLLTYPLTFITIWIEAFGWLGAFFPFKNGPVRTATVFLFWFFHLVALQSMMYLGPFPWTCSLGWILFLPSWFWDTLGLWWQRGRSGGLRRGLSAAVRPFLPAAEGTVLATAVPPRRPIRLGLRLPVALLAGFYLFVVVVWNIRTLNFGMGVRWFPPRWNAVAEFPHVDQIWDMFSPRPMNDDGWFVLPGHLRDGTTIDLMPYLAEYGDAPIISTNTRTWKKPDEVGTQFRDERWRKYFLNVWPSQNEWIRPYLCQYVARRWNRDHKGPKELCTMDIVYMREDTPMQYGEPRPPVAITICHHWCFPEFAPKKPKVVPSPLPSPSPTPHLQAAR